VSAINLGVIMQCRGALKRPFGGLRFWCKILKLFGPPPCFQNILKCLIRVSKFEKKLKVFNKRLSDFIKFTAAGSQRSCFFTKIVVS